MINKIKNKYYTYQPNEFLPIYAEGVLTNKNDFHIYKLKKAALAVDHLFQVAIDRAYSK